MVMAEAIDVGKDEFWGYWWKCSKCESYTIAGSNYCPNCGARLTLKTHAKVELPFEIFGDKSK